MNVIITGSTGMVGEGVWLEPPEGDRYLDCVLGIATNALGHAHPKLVETLKGQAEKLWHLSNMFAIDGQADLARRLVDTTFADLVFFANSGTEAMECALKVARRYHHQRGAPERIDNIGFAGSFHGRSYAAINASGNPSYLEGFGPRLPGYVQLSLDDVPAIEAAAAAPTAAAIIVEPVQGEGGARALTGEQLRMLRDLCDRHGLLLIYDEVQSGMGRTGKLFAHQWFEGVEPDIMTVAKALGGGFPIGACLTTREAGSAMTFGTHGSTFGGNPLAMAVGCAAFDLIADPATLAAGAAVAAHLRAGLAAIAERHPQIVEGIRGKGLLIGVKLVPNNRAFMGLARKQRLLLGGGGDNIVRLLPPFTMTIAEADEALARFEATCVDAAQPAAVAA